MPIPTTEETNALLAKGNILGQQASQLTGIKYSPVTLLSTDEAKTNAKKSEAYLNQSSPTTNPNYVPPEVKLTEPSKITYVNPNTEQETEFTPEELKNQKYIDYIKSQGLKRISGAVPDFELTAGDSTEEKEVKNLNTRIEGLANQVTTYNVDTDPEFKAQADTIRSQYTQLKEEMKKINYQRQQSLQTLGYRLGGQQYAGAVWKGIEGEEIRQSDARLTELVNKEAEAISAARKAVKEGKWKELEVQREALKDVRDSKSKELETYNKKLADIVKKARKEEDELKKRNKLVTQSQSVAEARSAGYETNEDIYAYLNSQGVDITAKEVGDVNDSLSKVEKAPNLGTEIERFKAVYPDVDIKTPEGLKKLLDFNALWASSTKGAWSEPYLLGGDYVQKNNQTGEIRTAVNVPKGTDSGVLPSKGFANSKIESSIREDADVLVQAGDKETAYLRLRNLYSPQEATDEAIKSILGIEDQLNEPPTVEQTANSWLGNEWEVMKDVFGGAKKPPTPEEIKKKQLGL